MPSMPTGSAARGRTPHNGPSLKRLHLPTVRRLFGELAVRAEEEQMSYRTYLEILMSEEIAHRAQTRIMRSARKARFPFLRTVEEFDFTFQSSIRLKMLGSFLGPEFVTEGRSAIFSGPPGRGKTHLAVALAYRAIQNGFDARFTTADELIGDLSRAAAEDRLDAEALEPYVHPTSSSSTSSATRPTPPTPRTSSIVSSTTATSTASPWSSRPTSPRPRWGRSSTDGDLAEAILDRVLERGTHFALRGSSYRTRHVKPEEAPTQKTGAA